MFGFLHKFSEGMRLREKMLKDHAKHFAFGMPSCNIFKQEYNALLMGYPLSLEKVAKREKRTVALASIPRKRPMVEVSA